MFNKHSSLLRTYILEQYLRKQKPHRRDRYGSAVEESVLNCWNAFGPERLSNSVTKERTIICEFVSDQRSVQKSATNSSYDPSRPCA